jgi:hypothetical protein
MFAINKNPKESEYIELKGWWFVSHKLNFLSHRQNWVITQWVLSHRYFSKGQILILSHKAPFFIILIRKN